LVQQQRLDFIYFDAGGGHRSAALALQSVISGLGKSWDVRLVNLQDVLDSLDIFRKITGIRLQDIYNLVLAKGWTLGSTLLLPCMHGVIRLYHRSQVKLLTEFWKSDPPAMVVSLVPNFNRALFESLKAGSPGTPFVTVLTDLADYPPHFWMEKQDQYLICGSDRAREQAQEFQYGKDKVFQTSGMILRPQFYDTATACQRDLRLECGLDPDRPTGLVLFGGEGSNVMLSIAKSLGNSAQDLQLVMICGRNESLRQKLSSLQTKNRIAVQGFTKDIPRFMQIADFFVGKPGPGSISEALKMGLPVIVERNAWTLPQERYNAQWVAENGFGVVLPDFRNIEQAVADMLKPSVFTAMKARIAALDNRAVFEIPVILEKILHQQRTH